MYMLARELRIRDLALVADKKEKKKKIAASEGAENTFAEAAAAGIPPSNTIRAMTVLRVLAVDYHVTAEQVDLIVELFDDVNHKVPSCPHSRP